MLLTAVTLSSCTKDVDYSQDGPSTVSVTVAAPSDVTTTRAAFANPDIEDMRLFLMLTYKGSIVEEVLKTDWDGTESTFTFDLGVGVTDYKITAWADYGSEYYDVTCGVGNSPVVEMASTTIATGSTSTYDAYFASASIATTGDVNLTLTRPFGLIKVNATDCNEPAVYNAGLVPEYYTITGLKVKTTFDPISGDLSNEEAITISGSSAETTTTATKCNLSFDYLFATSTEKADVQDFKIEYFKADSTTSIVSYDFSNIPVKRNYITSITGNILTKSGDVVISVDQSWEGKLVDVVRPDVCVTGTTYLTITADDVNAFTGTPTTNYVIPFTCGGTGTTVVIRFENATVAAAVNDLILDFSACNAGTSFEFTDANYTGMVQIGDYYDENYDSAEDIFLGDVTLNIPNASATLNSGYTITGLTTVTTASSTFVVEGGASVLGGVTVNGGRAVLDGTLDGTISGYNDAVIEILQADGKYDIYAVSGVIDVYYTQPFGFSFGINDVVSLFTTESYDILDYFDLGFKLQYTAAVGVFDFNNSVDGYNWTNLRNITYTSKYNGSDLSSATLKERLEMTTTTAAEFVEMIQEPIADFKDALNEKAEDLVEAVESISSYAPAELYTEILAATEELQANVKVFTETLPEITELPDGDGIPVGTVIPAPDNFTLDAILAIIGEPDDELSITDISDYISGDKTITLYMLVNIANDVSDSMEAVEEAQAAISVLETEKSSLETRNAAILLAIAQLKEDNTELAELEAEFNVAVATYENLAEPSSSGYIYGVTAATLTSGFELGISTSYYESKYSMIGSELFGSTQTTRMNAKNDQLDVINEIVYDYYILFQNLGTDELISEYNENQTRIDAIGKWTGTYEILGTDVDVSSAAGTMLDLIYAALSSYLGVDIDGTVALEDYLYDGELADLYLDLYAAKLSYSVYEIAFDELGIDTDILDYIIIAGDYLEQVVEVIDSVSGVLDTIEGYNIWEYTYTDGATFDSGIDAIDTKLEFEYQTGCELFIYSTQSTSVAVE